ncbi:TPA: hypothetical protein KKW42_001483 [Legionella pneumophila]|nr:hypothetical protein [Legionella pneumophila]HBD7114623.1 hypothetical protein [Legionella pneumophila]
MKSKSPRGKTPSLIGGENGKPIKIVANGKSTCKRCKCEIMCGESCFAIPKLRNAFEQSQRFCDGCFNKIIEQTEKDLEHLKTLLI